MFKIATLADWFGVGLINGIIESEKCGASGVQLFAWNELNPYEMTSAKIAEVNKVAGDCNQKVTALCGELMAAAPGGHGLEVAAENPKKIDYLKRVFDLGAELDCNIVTTHIGIIPADKNSEKFDAMQRACDEVGNHAKSMGAWLAIETGPETIETLCGLTDSCPSGRVAINYDPANLVMVTNDDEVQGVLTAGKRIVHTHAKDGILKKYVGPETIYGIFAEGGIDALISLSDCFEETPLGQGSVRWLEYLKALGSIGYEGYLTIEREVKEDAKADISEAVVFLKGVLQDLSTDA